mmetsp:Transcript_44030/g.71674  ORF Transcript_44030/g.71674 Transcript_44030/m.71674 type:complete len:444 (+) Transcript_44030:96-1427(+)
MAFVVSCARVLSLTNNYTSDSSFQHVNVVSYDHAHAQFSITTHRDCTSFRTAFSFSRRFLGRHLYAARRWDASRQCGSVHMDPRLKASFDDGTRALDTEERSGASQLDDGSIWGKEFVDLKEDPQHVAVGGNGHNGGNHGGNGNGRRRPDDNDGSGEGGSSTAAVTTRLPEESPPVSSPSPSFPQLAGLVTICSVGLQSRILADPQFLYKVFLEQAIGTLSVLAAELGTRGKRFWREFDFVLCDWLVTCFANLVAVWVVAPVVLLPNSHSQPSSSLPISFLRPLQQAMARLPAHVFEPALPGLPAITLSQRVATFFVRGFQYFGIGTVSGVAGTSLSYGIVEARKQFSSFSSPKDGHKELSRGTEELPPVLENGVSLGAFMAVSSNPRYQIVNGVEQVLHGSLAHSPVAHHAAIAAIRFANSVWGDAQWVWLSYFLGLQEKKN